MKKKVLLFPLATGIAALTLTSFSGGPATGGLGNHTGSNGSSASCSGGGCHASNNIATTVTIGLLDGATPVTTYIPGKLYTVVVTGATAGSTFSKFGFQASAVKAGATSQQAGTFATGGTPNIAVIPSAITGAPVLVEHQAPLNGVPAGGNMAYTVQFHWTAPAAGTGKVRFYTMLNAVNANGSSSGDQPNAATREYDENTTTSVGQISALSALSIYPNPATGNMATLRMDGEPAGNYMVAFYDMSGKLALQQPISVQQNNMNAALSTSALSAGMYHVHISGMNRNMNLRFVKQ